MSKFFRILSLLIICSFTAFGQRARYVVVISVDGFRPEFYKDASWPAPNLQAMAANGVYADGVRGVFPSVTYPSHTTIITGALPIKHGIYYNTPFEPQGQTGRWYWEESLINTETIWDAAKKAGLKTASVHWPVSVGAPIDYNIPEVWPNDRNPDRLAPMKQHTRPVGLFEETEQNATGKLQVDDLNSDYLRMDENLSRMAAYLIGKYKPNLTTVHLVCVDHFAHQEGREGEGVRKAVAGVDRAIGNIMEAVERAGIKDSTTFLIVGDHGFVDVHTQLAPNVWLTEAGLMEKAKDRGNWKATFHTSGGSAFLKLRNKEDSKTLKRVQEIIKALPEAQKKLFRVVERPELDKIGADPEVMLALAPIQGVSMSSKAEGPAVQAGSGGTHGYFPDFENIKTGFIGYGAGLHKSRVIPVMGLEDIAPVITQLLDLPFQSPDGTLYPGLLQPVK